MPDLSVDARIWGVGLVLLAAGLLWPWFAQKIVKKRC